MEVKTCTKCHKTYLLTDEHFRFNKSRNCFYSLCRECENEYNKAYYEANKEYVKECKKVYYEANKEYVKEHHKAYYEANKEHVREHHKVYREANKEYYKAYLEANKEHVREYHKVYREANKERIRKHNQNRRARIRSLDSTLTVGDWLLAVEEFGNKCAYCGKALKLEQDHFVPVSKGGGYTKDNIVPACKHCNSSKHNSAFGEWYHSQPFYSAKREKHILQYLGKVATA